MEGKYLISTDSWFFAPDGNQYKAAWGNVVILEDNMLGVKTNSRSSNWYACIGSNDKEVIVAGCQIHYAVKCPRMPSTTEIDAEEYHEGKVQISKVKSRIYIAE